MKNIIIVTLFAICLCSCKYNIATSPSEEIKHGNLRFEKNRLIVNAILADSISMEFELDSGCANGYANIDSATLEKISNIQPLTTNSNSGHISLQIDGHNCLYRYFINQHTRPLIGLNCTNSLPRWSINISQNQLAIIPDDSIVNFYKYHALPICIKHGLLPIVQLPITLYKNGKKHSFKRSFLVDTGAPTAFNITDPDDSLMHFVNTIPNCQYEDALTETFASQGRLREHRIFFLDSVAIQTFIIGKSCCHIDVGVRSAGKEFGEEVIGTVGMGVLKNFDIVFDYQNSKLLLSAHQQDMPLYEQAESGLGFTYSNNLRVSFVEQNHNAHRAGLQPGDKIKAINHISHERLLNSGVMDSLRMLPDNTPINMKVGRDNKIFTIDYKTFRTLK